jgi:hypothetical protein
MRQSQPRSVLLLLFVSALTTTSSAQKSESTSAQTALQTPTFSATDLAAKVPAPRPEDVKSMDAILRAVYDVISGPAGERDWNRFRSIFLPQARFTQTMKTPDHGVAIISWSVDEFIRDGREYFASQAFYENAIVNRPATFGNMAQVFSSYESRRAPGQKPFQRGINSIQLLNDGKRWWVVSILWDSERPDNPLPAKFAAKH